MMSQSRIESLVETCINTAIGFVVALASQLVIFPQVGIHVHIGTNLTISAWFTLISVARGYVVRRYFNSRIKSISQRAAQLAQEGA